MRIKTIALLCALLPVWCNAQLSDSLFYDIIEVQIMDEESDLYYPKLMALYQDSASYMTTEEKVHFYYGAKFQDFYSPTEPHVLQDSLMELMMFNGIDTIEGDSIVYDTISYEPLIDLCYQILEDDIINLNVHLNLLYLLDKAGKTEEGDLEEEKYKTLVTSVLESKEEVNGALFYMVLHCEDLHHVLKHQKWGYMGQTKLLKRLEQVKIEIEEKEKWVAFNIGPFLDRQSEE